MIELVRLTAQQKEAYPQCGLADGGCGDAGEMVMRVLPGREYAVGRTKGDLTFASCKSVSRQHAVLRLASGTLDTLEIDSKGQFKTFVNDKEVQGGNVHAKAGDVVRFGIASDKALVRVRRTAIALVVCASHIRDKAALQSAACAAAASVAPTWSKDASVLVMEKLCPTVKFLLALLDKKPIVTLSWLKAVANLPKGTSQLPSHKDFLPPCRDAFPFPVAPSLLEPNDARDQLFANTTVIVLEEVPRTGDGPVMSRIGRLIRGAGGKIEADSGTNNWQKRLSCGENIMFVAQVPNSTKRSVEVQDLLEKTNMKVVPECEVGYCLLLSSRKEYANPVNKKEERQQKISGKRTRDDDGDEAAIEVQRKRVKEEVVEDKQVMEKRKKMEEEQREEAERKKRKRMLEEERERRAQEEAQRAEEQLKEEKMERKKQREEAKKTVVEEPTEKQIKREDDYEIDCHEALVETVALVKRKQRNYGTETRNANPNNRKRFVKFKGGREENGASKKCHTRGVVAVREPLERTERVIPFFVDERKKVGGKTAVKGEEEGARAVVGGGVKRKAEETAKGSGENDDDERETNGAMPGNGGGGAKRVKKEEEKVIGSRVSIQKEQPRSSSKKVVQQKAVGRETTVMRGGGHTGVRRRDDDDDDSEDDL